VHPGRWRAGPIADLNAKSPGLRALHWLGWLAVIVAAPGCSSSLPGTDLPPTRDVHSALEFPELRDYRGIVDCRPSATGVDQSNLGDLAQAAQIDFVCLTDPISKPTSNYGSAGFTSQVLFLPGGSFAVSGGGEILGIDLHDPIDPALDAPQLIEEIHRQGAVAIANRVARFSNSSAYALADGIEVFNLAQAWDAAGASRIFLRAVFFGPDHFFGALDVHREETLQIYDETARGARVAMVAGMGAEKNLSVFGSTVGTFAQFLLVSTTHLLAAERQSAPLLDALRRGRAYASFDFLGYVPDFAFYAVDGESKTIMGDEALLSPATTLKAELPARADEIAIVTSGSRVAEALNIDKLEFRPKVPGAYRLEAYRAGHPWILSNPVYLR
jgi:hypothetical protein